MEISKQQIDFYNENGYLILKNIFNSDKIDSYNNAYKHLRKQFANECKIEVEDYEREISQVRDLWYYDKTFKTLLLQSKLPQIASTLMGASSARLLQ
jgi:hypothetical protein